MAQRAYSLRLACTLAMAGALAAIGCQQEAPTAARGSASPAAPASPMATLAALATPTPAGVVATLSPASVPPSAAASATPSAAASPLPAASVDSDLAQEDEAAVESLLDTDELKAYLPNDLIHDGGVILYQTLAVGGGAGRQKLGCAGPADPPEVWKRQGEDGGGRQLKLRKVGGKADVALAEIKYADRGTLVYRDGAAVRKKFVETFRRQIQLERSGKQWRPSALGPMTVESQGGKSGLDIKTAGVYRTGAATPAMTFDEQDTLVSLTTPLPTFKAGEAVRVEAEVADKQACDLFVFAYLVGGNDRTRQRLYDDGTNGDRVAGDGIYTCAFVLPATAGTRHLAVNVLDPTVFTPGGLYRSNVVGMSFKVDKDAP